ncbi:MAG: YihY/virulence factor BrkB family protein [Bacteroidota bacterium]|nr:YihY/virulence factor BrkB family protein [Bacteroidota bacterium]
MSKKVKIVQRFPFLKKLIDKADSIHLPGFEGMTAWDLWETYAEGITNGAFSARASSISYSFFMAIFPFVLFILNLIPFVPINNFQEDVIRFLNDLLPYQAAGAFDGIFTEIALKENTGLLTIAFFSSLIFMTNGVNAIFGGFERSYHSVLNRGFFRQYAVSLLVSIMLVLFLFVGVVLTIAVEYFLSELQAREYVSESSSSVWLQLIRYATLIFMLYVFIATLYYAGTKTGRQTRFFSIGATVTTVLILAASYLYGIYLENFATYNEIYGSIGAIIILMVYIWLNSNLLLVGFELNASLRSLKARNLNNT